jgi:hypothetical protein
MRYKTSDKIKTIKYHYGTIREDLNGTSDAVQSVRQGLERDADFAL